MLSEVTRRLNRLELEIFEAEGGPLTQAPQKPKRGRKPRLEKTELFERRDHLVQWLERNWPYLSVALRTARNSQQAIAAISHTKKTNPGIFHTPFYQAPEKYEKELWRFLKRSRFRGNPRNLAAALAALPELSCKTALDSCSKHPSKVSLAVEAYWDYLRRRFTDRWKELRLATTTDQVKAILKKSPTHDPAYLRLKEHPENVLEWFNLGKPPESLPVRSDSKICPESWRNSR